MADFILAFSAVHHSSGNYYNRFTFIITRIATRSCRTRKHALSFLFARCRPTQAPSRGRCCCCRV